MSVTREVKAVQLQTGVEMIFSVFLHASGYSFSDFEIETLFAFGCIVFLLAYPLIRVALKLIRSERSSRQQRAIDEHRILQYRKWQKQVAMSGELAPVLDCPLVMAKGEECLWIEMRATLLEVKSVRRSNHTFGSMPIGSTGIRIGKAYGTSESTDEWRPVAEGQLYFTNRQIYFDGDKQDRKIPLQKLSTIKSDWSAIEISSESRDKSMVFVGVNGKICQEIVRLVLNGRE